MSTARNWTANQIIAYSQQPAAYRVEVTKRRDSGFGIQESG
jgi:hypothetical protein